MVAALGTRQLDPSPSSCSSLVPTAQSWHDAMRKLTEGNTETLDDLLSSDRTNMSVATSWALSRPARLGLMAVRLQPVALFVKPPLKKTRPFRGLGPCPLSKRGGPTS